MQSNNPVLRRSLETAASERGALYAEGRAAYDQANGADIEQLERSFGAAAVGERAMQLPDVVAKTTLTLLAVAGGAVVGWSNPGLGLIGMIVGLVLGFVNAFKKQVVPALVVAYAVAQGLFIGMLSGTFSAMYADVAPNLVGHRRGVRGHVGAVLESDHPRERHVHEGDAWFTHRVRPDRAGVVRLIVLRSRPGLGLLRRGWHRDAAVPRGCRTRIVLART